MEETETISLRASELFSWSSIPSELLLAELSRRDDVQPSQQPQCGSGKKGTYDTAAHVGALVVILLLSTVSCALPLFSRQSSKGGSKRAHNIIFLCQHFGTGVLIATAFVHLLPTAFNSLTDPCLPYAFSKGYKPLAGLIAMVSALVVVALESYLTTRGAGHSHSHHHHVWDDEDAGEDQEDIKLQSHGEGGLAGRRGFNSHRPRDITLDDLDATEGLVAGVSPLPGSTPTVPGHQSGKTSSPERDQDDGSWQDDEDDDAESLDLELNLDELQPAPINDPHSQAQFQPLTRRSSIPTSSGPGLAQGPNPEEQKRLLLQCLLLEAGILFHSIFIGMAISVATGPTFVVFLVAIGFHQSFEGLALGSRIAAIHFPKSSLRPWLMVLAYGTTTPIGQAIGLFVHNLYDPMSQTGLLMVGFMNAISSGLLLFAGLVQLLAEDFLTEKSYKTLHGRRRVNAFLAVVAGAGLMAAVGAFA
ncbi:Zinc/iron permease [Diplogelasinospora grovesii]|uniref:Zinc/iron permease n=1 Tax=Diplogelasinospora grovesii TaxID=303347 RepID=A0AAN6S1Y5_9PEZI|nr:Zinc/iron permease [Diplogelasinospora grovesii]